jgi:hypothetical protein
VTFFESNRRVRPTGEEPGEFIDDGPLDEPDRDDDASDDPTRRPTGSLPSRPEHPPDDHPDA